MLSDFDHLFQSNKDRIFQLALRMMGRVPEAEDVCQEVFLRALEHLDDFREESQASTWLHRIAINLCVDRLRSIKRRPIPIEPIPSDESDSFLGMDHFPDPSPTFHEVLEKEELAELIRQAIARMKPKYRDVLVLGHLQEMPHKDIAQILDISVDAVAVRLNRARNDLKSKLKKYL